MNKELREPLMCKAERQREDVEHLFDYKDTTIIMAIICSAFVTWLLHYNGLIMWDNLLQAILMVAACMFAITCAIVKICEKITKEKSLS